MITRRAVVSLVSLIVLLVFLLGLTLKKLDAEHAERIKYQNGLASSQQSIVDKLTEVFTNTIKEETVQLEHGQTPQVSLQSVIDKLNGIDPKLIQEAVQKAMLAVGKAQSPSTTTTTSPATTTSTARATTTSTTRPTTTSTSPTTTSTTRPAPTTTTTRPCVVHLAGLKLICT